MSDQSLKERIAEDTKSAMRAKEKERLGTLRLIGAAIKQREVDERITLDDSGVLAALEKMLKQRRDSIEQFRKAGRDDLADKEAAEIAIIGEYMPTALSDAEIDSLIDEAVQSTGAASMKEMGSVMAVLRPRIQGRADMGAVSARIKARLSS
jgi:uncharacterized protein